MDFKWETWQSVKQDSVSVADLYCVVNMVEMGKLEAKEK